MVRCWHGYLSGVRCRLAHAQLMPLPLTISCSSKIQIGFTFLVPAHLRTPGKRAVKWVCVYVPIQSAEAEALISMHTDFRSVFMLLQPFVRQPLFASCPVKSMDKYSAAKFYSPTEGNQSTYTGSIPDLLGKNKR